MSGSFLSATPAGLYIANKLGLTAYPVTLAGWIKPTTWTDASVFGLCDPIGGSTAVSNMGYRSGDGLTEVTSYNGSGPDDYIGSSVSTGAWHHVVYRYNSSTALDVILDNVKTSYTIAHPVTMANFLEFDIGSSAVSSFFYRNTNGLIAYPAVWSTALSDADVTALHGHAAPSTIPTGLRAYYKFNATGAGLTTDSSGNGYTLTNSGVTYSSDEPFSLDVLSAQICW